MGIDYISVLALAIISFDEAVVTSAFTFHAATSSRVSHTSLSMSSALIVQNKGGGHGELGYQLAKNLQANFKDTITSITILQDDACNDEKEPFKSYGDLGDDVKIIKAPLGDDSMTAESIQSILGEGESFEYIWDNASKKPEGVGKAICDCAKTWDPKLYTYVSSAGMYQPTKDQVFPMDEDTTPIKESAGQNLFEKYAAEEVELPFVSFRPQYIYGPKANKYDYIDWYFDRLVRDLPLPIPGDGKQKVSLTNSKDVAAILSSVLNDPDAAVSQRFFNCGTDELFSYDEVAYLCAQAADIPKDAVKIEHYDADFYGKATFPFRMTDFYVAPDKVKDKLGWKGAASNLEEELSGYYEGYKQRGKGEGQMNLMKDWEIIVGSKSSWSNGSVYDKWDPLVVDMSDVKPLKVDI